MNDAKDSEKEADSERDGLYGALIVKSGRMWAVPFHDHDEVKGPAREVVGFGGPGKDEMHEGGFAAFKEKVEQRGASGIFYFDEKPDTGLHTPIELTGSPWYNSLDPRHLEQAHEKVDEAISKDSARTGQGLLAQAATVSEGPSAGREGSAKGPAEGSIDGVHVQKVSGSER